MKYYIKKPTDQDYFMIIVMKHGASEEQCTALEKRITEAGLEPHVIHGTERNVYGAVGDERGVTQQYFEVCDGVEQVMPILAPYKLASSEIKKEKSIITVGNTTIGGKQLSIMAGPCCVENREMMFEAAELVKKAGATMLRGGAYKPRTNPYAFQGLEEEGLKYLSEAGKSVDLPVVTPDTSVRETLGNVSGPDGRTSAALVLNESGALVGIFTDGDLRRHIQRDSSFLDGPIDAVMVKNPKTLTVDTLVADAQKLMKEHRIDEVPVVDDAGRPIGVLDVQDLLEVGFAL